MALRIRIRSRQEPALRPAEDFSPELAPWSPDFCGDQAERKAGLRALPHAGAIKARIARSTAGWRVRPTPAEFDEALRATDPTDRQCAIVDMWAREAAPREMLLAWLQRAYDWRALVDALHRHGLTRRGELNGYLNLFVS